MKDKINDIRKKNKKIIIHTKRLTQSSLTGDYQSAFKGSGLEFNQLREYQIGDDIRFIDWNSSAKKAHLSESSKMMVKQFIEERDRVIILAIDVSASSAFSSQKELRDDTIAQAAAALTFIATENKDKVGALFFSDHIEKWIPPKRGKSHFGTIIETLFSITSKCSVTGRKTSIAEALKFLLSLKQRNAITFMLSDWIDKTDNYAKLLKVASIKFDFVSIRLLDTFEKSLPDLGLIELQNPETGKNIFIDTRGNKLNSFLGARKLEQENMFKKYKIDLLDLTAGKPFVNNMVKFFHKRIRRQI